jgi:hypothetical protein
MAQSKVVSFKVVEFLRHFFTGILLDFAGTRHRIRKINC